VSSNPPPVPEYQRPTDGVAIGSLILGIMSLLALAFCVVPALPFGIGALVAGFMSRRNIGASQGTVGGDGIALAGLICGAIGSALALLLTAYFLLAVGGLVVGGPLWALPIPGSNP
jgi:hypothetical protein